MSLNTISIILPVYCIEAYLPRCLDSILAQTYQNIELIAVDDGSPDNCGSILDDYSKRDSRIVVIHQNNAGVMCARFAGIRAATGTWIGFVDGDDYVEPDMFEHLLNNALKYNADISHCGYQMVFPNRVDYYYNTGCLIEQDNITGIKDLLEGRKIEPGLWNKLFHNTLFHSLLHKKNGVENLGIKINEDLLMNFYLFKEAEKSVYEDFCPYHYIVRKNSAANSRRDYHFIDSERVAKIILEEAKDIEEYRTDAFQLYVRRLISSASQRNYPQIAVESESKLRELYRNKQFSLLSAKNKYMALMIVYCMPVYRLVRWGYDKITRINHKYDIE